jgi:hypothetical protein
MTRALSTLVGAALAGGLIWVAAQVDQSTTGGYWAVIGILGGAGLAIALARLPDVGVRTLVPSLPTFALAFLPSLIAGGWVVVASQPHGNTWRGHVLSWSSDIGVTRVVSDLGPYAVVLAFGLGALLGLVFERRTVEEIAAEPAVPERVQQVEPAASPREPASSDEKTETRERELVHH